MTASSERNVYSRLRGEIRFLRNSLFRYKIKWSEKMDYAKINADNRKATTDAAVWGMITFVTGGEEYWEKERSREKREVFLKYWESCL